MVVKGQIKRGPGRPWGSTSKNKFGSSSSSSSGQSTSKSWSSASPAIKVAPRGKPPGRPWHTNSATKVCLICLCQYNQDLTSPEDSSDEDDEDNEDGSGEVNGPRDPLSEEVGMALDLMACNSKLTPRGSGVKIPRKKKANLFLRFLTILSRHLQMNTKRFRSSALRNELPAPFCDRCRKTVEQLCKFYEDLHNAKLGLEWRLKQISDSIKVSKGRVSGKLQCTLLKSLSTQLRVVGSQVVDVFRKQVSIRCSAKLVNPAPRVSISKNSVVNAVKANWKWKFAFDQMRQYLQSLIVVFSLAVPPTIRPEKKHLAIAGPKSKTRKVHFNDKFLNVKREGGIEAKKENVPPKDVKREPGHGGEDGDGADDDDHFGGGDYSPPGSGPTSPVGGHDDEGQEVDGNKNANDSDWSAGAASGNDSGGSDVEFSINTNTVRRWNLRRRRTRSKSGAGDGDDSDTDYVPGSLPPLRGSSSVRQRIPESEKKFSCNLCSQKFSMDRGLKRHLSQAHAFLMIYNCPKCPNLRFRKSKDLEAHRKKVHKVVCKPGERLPYMGCPTACTVCEKMFPSKIKMMIHRKTAHKMMSALLTCEICDKKVRGQIRMEYHLKSHARPDKPHRCTKCPRGFGTEDGLKVHMKIHEDNPGWVPFVRVKNKVTTPREGIFKCDIEGCGKSFYKSSNLTIHKSLHQNDFACDTCGFKCRLLRNIRRHLAQVHEKGDKKYFCLHCDKAYVLEQTYDFHKKIAHPTRAMLDCDVDECQEQFDNTEQLRQHLKTMHLPPEVEETKENFKFYDVYGNGEVVKKKEDTKPPTSTDSEITASEATGSETVPPQKQEAEGTDVKPNSESKENITKPNSEETGNMFEDLLLVNPEKTDTGEVLSDPPRLYTCARCDWSFSRKIMYSLHLILHTPRDEHRQYSCDLCDKSFGVVDSLQTHYNRIHGPRIKPYLCLTCGVRFHRKESFIPHMRIHKDKGSTESFKCTECDKTFRDSVNLRKHTRMAHKKEVFQRTCDVCQENFPGKMALMMHKVDAHGMEKPYLCKAEGCGKGFFNFTQLRDHKICHAEATFACTLCPKKFKRRHNLADHYLVHQQIKNHFCEYCGRAFVKKSSLNLHLDIHRGIKKYTCEYCGKAFCRKFARDCHLRVHTKERPYKCEICGSDFAQYSALKMHQKNHEKLNNDKIVRVPFKKSVGVGKPLKTRKRRKKKESDEEPTSEEEEDNEQSNHQQIEEPSAPTSSGILHEAMKAAFDDINMELEIGAPDIQLQQQTFVGGGPVIDEMNAAAAVTAVEQTVPKEEDENSEEEEEMEIPAKTKRKRKPKVYKKEYSCGFCGKTFHREDFYNKHVDRHMKEVEAETPNSVASQQSHHSSLMEEHNSLQDVLQDVPQSSSRRSHTFAEPTLMNSHSPINVPTPPHLQQQQQYQPPPPLAPAPILQQEPPKRRGRPPKRNSAPGSRLARIVEDVLETAAARQPPPQYPHQQPQQFPTPPPPHHHVQTPSPHHVQSPSPHHIVHSGSERSTPTGSPAPNHPHHQQQHQQQTVTTTSTSTSLPFPVSTAASILSPFLFNNPYLIPRMPDQQNPGIQQQDSMFAGFQNRQQQQQNTFSPHILPQQTTVTVNYPQQHFHQPSQQTTSQSSTRSLPQDLSKSNYSIFYNNQR